MMRSITSSPRPRQSGMSLFPALMFLLVLSVIGVAALNSTLMQEKMVSNTKDLNIAFQSAEAGLRDAEADVARNIDTGAVFTSTCVNGLCTPPSTWPSATSADISKVVESHEAIANAIEQGTAGTAGQLMKKHFEDAQSALSKVHLNGSQSS